MSAPVNMPSETFQTACFDFKIAFKIILSPLKNNRKLRPLQNRHLWHISSFKARLQKVIRAVDGVPMLMDDAVIGN
ncbi:hypothetical protein CGZ65_07290 [Neisseria weixii]|nr:hypothetical protein CGZ65_07290 [Neisseria weixii]